ncbi:hypothetical protein [Gayadomonas joobiniege]|uniref:hypothetical protein n=1 Tax=Gayadomonas joobiniege TaxID=1234606 RepID=UPI00035DB25E|nr:hypothetical protein [Gayadomonas joobiniege]
MTRLSLYTAAICSMGLLVGCSAPESEGAYKDGLKSLLAHQADLLVDIMDFEQDNEQIKLLAQGARYEYSPAFNGSKGSLTIHFSADHYRSIVKLQPQVPWDWSSYPEAHIAFEAENLSDQSIQLYLSLADSQAVVKADDLTGSRAYTANRSINLAAGERGRYFAIIKGKFTQTDAGIREKPKPWSTDAEMFTWRTGKTDLDYRQITELALYTRGNLQDKSIRIDNLRLLKNPTYQDDYLVGLVDQFGQNAKQDFPIKISSADELKTVAEAELKQLAAEGQMADRSRFGGWKSGPKLAATGYFRTEKVNGKWWMVDPEGHLFFSHGVANVRMANLTTLTGVDFKDPNIRQIDADEVTPEDSIGIVQVSEQTRKTRYIASGLRHKMFNWLPDYNDPLADHYSYRRKVLKGPLTSGETYSFYRANLERKYGQQYPESYIDKWRQVTLDRMQNWGFTSFGNWVDPGFYNNKQVPYFANGWIIGNYKTLASEHDVWAPMPDPFDAEFKRRAEVTISVIADEIKESPWCVGIFIDNEKSWGMPEGNVEERYGVILGALANNAVDSPAKAAFSRQLKNQYGKIAALNSAWQSDFADWSEFEQGFHLNAYSDAAVADISNLLEMLSEQYFKVVHDTLGTYLPNHLYMGARMANFGMPKETIKASVKYSDVLSFNIYEEGMQSHQWDFLKAVDLPTVIGEFHIGATRETGLFHSGLVQADNQKDRAQMYYDYMQSVAGKDYMVGAHWFQYIDSPITGRAFDGEPYNVGFVSTTDIPYPEMVAAAKRFNRHLYQNRFNR